MGYIGPQPAAAVPVTLNDIFPVAGRLLTFPIVRTVVDFDASPDGFVFVTATVPWTNTAYGAHIIQAVATPSFEQYTGDDQATRLIFVGLPVHNLSLQTTVRIGFDADGNGLATPGDTLLYTIEYANTGTTDVTGATIIENYNGSLLETPFNLSLDGTVAGGTITWALGTIAADTSDTVTYEVQLKPAAAFSRPITPVIDTTLLSTDQTATIYATAEIDVIGDTTPPTTTAAVTPEPNAAGWNNTQVSLILTATDNPGGLGVKEIHYAIEGVPTTVSGNQATVPFTQEGCFLVSYYAIDSTGNAEAEHTLWINIDKTAPTITAERVTPANAYGWNNTDVVCTYTAGDGLSGLPPETGNGSHTFTAEGAGQAWTFTVTDLAGNSASATVSGINIDKTASTITGAPDRAANSYGWYNQDVTVSFTGDDDLSGVESVTAPVTLGEGAGQGVTGTVTDLAGNSASYTVSGINIDLSPPLTTGTPVGAPALARST